MVECQKSDPSLCCKRMFKEFNMPFSLFVISFCAGLAAPQEVIGIFRV